MEHGRIENSSKVQKNTQGTKTELLAILGIITIIFSLCAGIYVMTQENFLTGIVVLFVGFASFAFINGFSDIIDLLESINNKLDNIKK